jgi:hypothetical protein
MRVRSAPVFSRSLNCERSQRIGSHAPFVIPRAGRSDQGVVVRESVEQVYVIGRIEKRVVFVLSVQFDQRAAQVLERR